MIRMKDGTYDHIIMDLSIIMSVSHRVDISNVIGDLRLIRRIISLL